MLERREYIRYDASQKSIIKDNESSYNGIVEELSLKSVKISMKNKVDLGPGTYIDILNNKNQMRDIPVRLERIESTGKATNYIFQFRIIDENHKNLLDKYLSELHSSKTKERRKKERRTEKLRAASQNKRRKDRRLTYPIFLKSIRVSNFKNLMKNNRYFFLREISSACCNKIKVYGKELINFASNNYLGLTTHPAVVEAGIKAMEKYGSGSGGVRILSGTMHLHNKLEKKLANFKGGQDCVVFSTGYTTNIAAVSCISGKNDVILIDEKAHASIIDGCVLAGSQIITFKHNNMNDLERKIKKIASHIPKIILTDGVFSMDGDIADVPRLYEIAEKYRIPIMIDDAHATGVIGKDGRGTASHFNMEGKISIIAGTLSKAIGGLGGFIVANKDIVHMLKHYSRGFLFTTSLPPQVIASAIKSIEIMETEPKWHKNLLNNMHVVRKELISKGFDIGNTESAIIPIMLRNKNLTYEYTKRLQDKGIFVNGIEYPAVRKRESRLRVSIMATHTQKELDYFLDTVTKIGRELKVI